MIRQAAQQQAQHVLPQQRPQVVLQPQHMQNVVQDNQQQVIRIQHFAHGNPDQVVQQEQEQVRQAPIRRRIQGQGQFIQQIRPVNIPVVQQRVSAAFERVENQIDLDRVLGNIEFDGESHIDMQQQAQHDNMLRSLRQSVSQQASDMSEYSPALQGSIASPPVQRQIVIDFDRPFGQQVEEERKTPTNRRSPIQQRNIRILALEEERDQSDTAIRQGEEESSLLTPPAIREERKRQAAIQQASIVSRRPGEIVGLNLGQQPRIAEQQSESASGSYYSSQPSNLSFNAMLNDLLSILADRDLYRLIKLPSHQKSPDIDYSALETTAAINQMYNEEGYLDMERIPENYRDEINTVGIDKWLNNNFMYILYQKIAANQFSKDPSYEVFQPEFNAANMRRHYSAREQELINMLIRTNANSQQINNMVARLEKIKVQND